MPRAYFRQLSNLNDIELRNYRFRTWTSHPFELSVEESTPDESVASLKQLLNGRLWRARVIEVDAGVPTENPIKAIVGTWRDNPLIDDVRLKHPSDQ